ncbi:conserved hypothetical protein [Bacillus thuringiensis str. Al Hakam]|nr:conserved hypothetical protein [Bacillus thuringiensis str. Al Hakam]
MKKGKTCCALLLYLILHNLIVKKNGNLPYTLHLIFCIIKGNYLTRRKIMTQNISQGERIHSIDIIRGIAVLGIFLVNWPIIAGIDSRDLSGVYEGLDSYIRLFYDMFIQTKFYTIFSFLFGLGFYIFMTRAEAKTDRPKTLFVRRLLILLLFGFLHYVLLWDGDILHSYAIAGFFLFLFYKRKPRTILIWAIVLLSIFQFLMLIATIGIAFMPKEELGLSLPIMPLEDWVSQIQNRFHAFYANGIGLNVSMLPETVGLFLLGLYAGKKDIFRRTKELDPKLKKWQIIMFVLTLPFWFFMVRYFLSTSSYEPLYMQGLAMFSGKTLFIFYIFTLMRLLQKEKWQTLLRPFQYVGRMALTNYISHTIVTLLVFGLLLKSYYTAPLWVGPLFCVGFYTLQIFISRWWLSRYQYGPLEYIWRLGTYGKMMPLKKKSKVS